MGVSEARGAAAGAALELVEPGSAVGLGSGRALWALLELIGEHRPGVRAACASARTEELAAAAGIEVIELDGETRLEAAFDGADEIDPDLGLVKGGGAALLREKLVVSAADRFVVLAEASKRVGRLGETRPLPVEVVRFAWPDTRRRLLGFLPSADLRTTDGGEPLLTDEGHHLLDCGLPPGEPATEIGPRIKATVGVVEHGLFLDVADVVLLGQEDGRVERLEPER